MYPKIFPAIDIIDGKCVRLSMGDYDLKKIYSDHPLDMALQFQDAGAEYLHIVDLDAAKDPTKSNRLKISQIIETTRLKVQIGGGLRAKGDLDALFNIGTYRVIVGSKAVTDREEVYKWIDIFGSESVVIGADVKGNMISTHGWFNVSDEDIFTFLSKYIIHGATHFLCTDIAKDGMMSGSSQILYKKILGKFPGISLIASGGVHNMDEVNELSKTNVESIIIGKALYEGTIDLKSLLISLNNIP